MMTKACVTSDNKMEVTVRKLSYMMTKACVTSDNKMVARQLAHLGLEKLYILSKLNNFQSLKLAQGGYQTKQLCI